MHDYHCIGFFPGLNITDNKIYDSIIIGMAVKVNAANEITANTTSMNCALLSAKLRLLNLSEIKGISETSSKLIATAIQASMK